jgi:hypothetical protein
VLDALVLVLTLHARGDFHPGGGAAQTSVMTLGQALGWFIAVVLFLVLVVALTSAIRAQRRSSRAAARRR